MSNKPRICHITNWYPNKWNQKEALWVRRHVRAIAPHTENVVYHVQVREGKFGFHSYKMSENEDAIVLTTNLRIWFLKEIITTLLLWYVLLFKVKRSKVDVYNFHIAYPLLTYSRILTAFVKKPIYVTEHWSAYHFNFGVAKKLKRIQRIFANKSLKFICVSQALKVDIEKFSGHQIDAQIIPNAIDVSIFKDVLSHRSNNKMFMLSYWKVPKDPFPIMKATKELLDRFPDLHLDIGGFGPLVRQMEEWIKSNQMEKSITLLGQLDSNQIAEHLQKSTLFLHSSRYEVASVACMEALSCGCPVLASNVGGIREYIREENGLLVDVDDEKAWSKSIAIALKSKYDYARISTVAADQFGLSVVGNKYSKRLLGYNETD